jgi:hypothetical protein
LILLHFIKAKCAISDDIAGQRRASTSVTSAGGTPFLMVRQEEFFEA